MWRGVAWPGVVRRGVVWPGVAGCCVVWRSVVRCGVVWCLCEIAQKCANIFRLYEGSRTTGGQIGRVR